MTTLPPDRAKRLSRPAPSWEAGTWGPYFEALFPPQEVSPWIAWKIRSTGVGVARRLWDQREQLRGEYEDVHGTDRARWPVQHPGVVLDAVPSTAHGACLGDPENWPHRHPGIVIDAVQFVAHAACLGCQWIDQPGTSMEEWRNPAGVRPPPQ